MEQVKHAIATLYSNQSAPDDQKAADLYLQDFMKKKDAWGVIPVLLACPSTDPLFFQHIYYGAIMLKKKMCYNFKEVSDIKEMFTFITQMLVTYKSIQMVTVHLSQALTALCVQSDQWSNFLPLIIERFPVTIPENVPILLMIFSSVAEGLDRLSFTNKDILYSLRQSLASTSSQIIQFICDSFKYDAKKSYECLSSWMKYVKIPFPVLLQHNVIQIIFLGLKDKTLFQYVTDAFVYYCRILKKIPVECPLEDVETREKVAVGILSELCTSIPMLITQYGQSALEELSEFFLVYLPVLTEYLEVMPFDGVTKYFVIISQLTSIKSEDIMAYIFESTDYFFTHLAQVDDKMKDQVTAVIKIPFLQIFKNVITIQAIIPDGLDVEEQEDFAYYRLKTLTEFLREISSVIDMKDILLTIEMCLAGSNSDWHKVEGAIFGLRAMVRLIEVSEKESEIDQIVNRLIGVVINIHSDKLELMHTTIFTAGRFCEWIHLKCPGYALKAMDYIMKYAGVPELAEGVFVSFDNLCDTCADVYQQCFEQLTQVFITVYKDVVPNWNVNGDTYKPLISGYASLLNKRSRADQDKMLYYCINPIVEELKKFTSEVLVCTCLSIIMTWLRYTNKLDMGSGIIELSNRMNMIGVIESIVNKGIDMKNEKIVESGVSVVEYFLYAVGSGIYTVANGMVEMSNRWWERTHHSSVVQLYIAIIKSLFVDSERGKTMQQTGEIREYIFKVSVPMLDMIFQYLIAQDEPVFDTIINAFALIIYLYSALPMDFEKTVLHKRVVPWALHFLKCPQKDVYVSVIDTLMMYFVTCKTPSSSICLLQCGEDLLFSIFRLVNAFPTRERVNVTIDFLWSLYTTEPETVTQKTLNVIQKNYSFLPNGILIELSKTNLNKENYKNNVEDFFYVCKESC
ncbi:transportin-3, putative [Entamoeba invadens IP1]|uniref:Transportin-3, putative n=1 Tax=Entamoeba invadens IP1 TaxID=370355 RepID=A0A0A1U5I6_ENTIV|nr:transportin-3, putative [Entamoeba invadens IP1]ELP89582.1 transportin-3, putative [Entamoeba invadens IP1]|eukprot:XP_004256353.1 transportin-3, putative [Entamoeba invadens IP1]